MAVMSYIRQKLSSNPIDAIMLVEDEKIASSHLPVLDHWLQLQCQATSREGLDKEGTALSDIVQSLVTEYSELGLDCDGLSKLGKGDRTHVSPHASPDLDFQTDEERFFTDPPSMPAKLQPTQQTRRKSALQAELKQASSISPIDLPISFLLRDLSRRLQTLFDDSFEKFASSIQVNNFMPVVTWQPPAIEEDDALAVLGLARDPTKITSRMVRKLEEDSAPCFFIACETPPNSLPSYPMDEPACKCSECIYVRCRA